MSSTDNLVENVVTNGSVTGQSENESQLSLEFSQDEYLNKYSNSILAGVIRGDEVSLANRKHLFGQLQPHVFKNENFVIYKILHRFKDLENFELDVEFINLFLDRNQNIIMKSSSVDLKLYNPDPKLAIMEFIVSVEERYKLLLTLPPPANFKLDVEKYRIEYLASEARKDLDNGRIILDEGMQVGRRAYQGYEDMTTYLKQKWAKLESVSQRGVGEGFTVLGETSDDEEVSKVEMVGSYGIAELDNHFNAIYSGDMISVLAPTKGGKTKFCTHVVHRTVVEHGNSVVVWPKEGGKEAWEAQIRARHFYHMYNKDVTDLRKKKLGVDVDTIKKNLFETDELRQLEQASKLDLYSNPNYGRIVVIDRPFTLENFVEEIDTAVQMVGAKLIFIDYLQLLISSEVTKKNECIGRGYQEMLSYLKKYNIAGIFPAQYTQDFVKDLSKSKDSTTIEARVGGGESAEVIRTPDINLGLYASAEDLQRGQMTFLSIPSRTASPFPQFDTYCDLGVCFFSSLKG